jgi:hypothetical protein
MNVRVTACGAQIGPECIDIEDVTCESGQTKVYVWEKGLDHVQVTIIANGDAREFHVRRSGIRERRIFMVGRRNNDGADRNR